MSTHPMIAAAAEFLRRESVGGGILVAVSGGPDSVALVHALAEIPTPGRLWVGHVHHGLRGGDADADQAFVIALAGRLGLPVRVQRIDAAAEARRAADNLESAARRARYRKLAETAAEVGVPFIATGHTADDQAETVLHHVLRGTGIRGLCGISRRRRLAPGIDLIRPLLAVPRRMVQDFLRDRGLPFCHDASNEDLRLTRNRIRRELLPRLAEEFNPRIVENLCRLSRHAAELLPFLDRQAADLLILAERPRAGDTVVLDAATLQAAPAYFVRELFHRLWQREGWPMGRMDFAAWQRLAAIAAGQESAADFPGKVRVRKKGSVVQAWRRTVVKPPGEKTAAAGQPPASLESNTSRSPGRSG